jgi:hypothetical protein
MLLFLSEDARTYEQHRNESIRCLCIAPYCTVRVTLVLWDRLPLVPVTVMM